MRLLIVHHTPSPSLQALLEAAIAGTQAEGIEGVETVVRAALAATVSDVLGADGFLLGTPANIGYMSGALKVFFDSVYYPTLLAKVGAPYGLYVQGNTDTAGAVRAVESIAGGMGWVRVHEPVALTGSPPKEAAEAVWELAATVAAHVGRGDAVTALEEPSQAVSEPLELLLAYLDYYRDTAIRKCANLAPGGLRISRVPSGWAPIELLQHLAYMERRWLQWGFAGEPVADPYGDEDPATERWMVSPMTPAEEVFARLRAAGARTRELAAGRSLTDIAKAGGRFSTDKAPPTLGWILLHVLQEYARHVGHLDIARELADGAVGE